MTIFEKGDLAAISYFYVKQPGVIAEAEFIMRYLQEDDKFVYFQLLHSPIDFMREIKVVKVSKEKINKEFELSDEEKKKHLEQHQFWAFIMSIKAIKSLEKLSVVDALLKLM